MGGELCYIMDKETKEYLTIPANTTKVEYRQFMLEWNKHFNQTNKVRWLDSFELSKPTLWQRIQKWIKKL